MKHTQYNGPFHFPSQAGGILTRSKFLDGTYKAYWAPKGHRPDTVNYVDPPFWPAAGAPALIPRVVRMLGNSSTPGNIYEQTFDLVDTFLTGGGYRNLWSSKATTGLAYQPSGNSLVLGYPVAADLASNNYYATDTLNIFVNTEMLPTARYTGFSGGSVTINNANVEFDAEHIQQTGEQAPRYHLRVYFHSVFPTASSATLAGMTRLAMIEIYSVLFPSLIDSEFYSYGGMYVTADLPTTLGNDIISYVTTHYGL